MGLQACKANFKSQSEEKGPRYNLISPRHPTPTTSKTNNHEQIATLAIWTYIMQKQNEPLGSRESKEAQTPAGRRCKGASIGKLDRARKSSKPRRYGCTKRNPAESRRPSIEVGFTHALQGTA
ncbi:uncharacterized protein N7511_004400 [Penicillium nucicola]|uniref:uncharacterized protein n=1 Tax=Penicillium nucicola TaxID=1850975 RepID=UPI00254574A3|nr:uncharacterized protein N7511_004400 [Penicillium nucicola]KAJ5766784.1 hypothetical protein N7511_004400 [Penicillium nucicola]